ncbi:MAG: hypothetical protein ACP5IE_08545, partial [Infirmifilum sp.]
NNILPEPHDLEILGLSVGYDCKEYYKLLHNIKQGKCDRYFKRGYLNVINPKGGKDMHRLEQLKILVIALVVPTVVNNSRRKI